MSRKKVKIPTDYECPPAEVEFVELLKRAREVRLIWSSESAESESLLAVWRRDPVGEPWERDKPTSWAVEYWVSGMAIKFAKHYRGGVRLFTHFPVGEDDDFPF